MSWLVDRLKEPSTYAALAPVLLYIGVNVDEGTLGTIGAGIAALLGIVLKERGR